MTVQKIPPVKPRVTGEVVGERTIAKVGNVKLTETTIRLSTQTDLPQGTTVEGKYKDKTPDKKPGFFARLFGK